MRLRLGLGLQHGGDGVSVLPPTDIAWAGDHDVDENSALGTVIGGDLTGTDPGDLELTFSLVDDHNGTFGISPTTGINIIVTGVPDFEDDPSPSITIRATNSGGASYNEVFEITVNDVAETAPENPLPPGDVIVDDPANHDVTPHTVEVDGAIKIAGKKKAGGVAKFVYDIGALGPSERYTIEYTPDFSLLADEGANVLVGFVMKQGNDFHIVGLKGDGSAGIDKYKLSGDGLWAAGSGFTEVDGGAPTNGSQAGPNFLRLDVSGDGTNIRVYSGASATGPWTEEFSEYLPHPFSAADDATTFGIGAFFPAASSGSYSISITQWIEAIASVELLWNASDKGSGIVLLDGNKEAYHRTGTAQNVRGNVSFSSGKYCWAMVWDGGATATPTFRAGIANSDFDVDGGILGGLGTGDVDSVVITGGAAVLFESGTIVDYGSYNIGDHVLVAFDATAGKIWFGQNGSWFGEPDAGTNAAKADVAAGTWFPAFGHNLIGPSSKMTLIPFPIAPPAGFTVLQPEQNVDQRHWESVHFKPLATLSANWNGNNLRQLITAAQLLDKTGSKIRFRLRSGTGEGAQISDAAWGEQAASGDVYDMESGTPSPLNFSGNPAQTIPVDTMVTSDEFTYAYDGSKGLIVAAHFNSAANDIVMGTALTGYNTYFKAAANEVDTANVTTYSTSANVIRLLEDIQVYVED